MEGKQTAKVSPLTPIPVLYKKRVTVADSYGDSIEGDCVTVDVDAFDLVTIDIVNFDTVAIAVRGGSAAATVTRFLYGTGIGVSGMTFAVCSLPCPINAKNILRA
jgi:hypothetical protein